MSSVRSLTNAGSAFESDPTTSCKVNSPVHSALGWSASGDGEGEAIGPVYSASGLVPANSVEGRAINLDLAARGLALLRRAKVDDLGEASKITKGSGSSDNVSSESKRCT